MLNKYSSPAITAWQKFKGSWLSLLWVYISLPFQQNVGLIPGLDFNSRSHVLLIQSSAGQLAKAKMERDEMKCSWGHKPRRLYCPLLISTSRKSNSQSLPMGVGYLNVNKLCFLSHTHLVTSILISEFPFQRPGTCWRPHSSNKEGVLSDHPLSWEKVSGKISVLVQIKTTL